ncbi:MAG: ACT domain-containing protein [Chloroflexota bacterium]
MSLKLKLLEPTFAVLKLTPPQPFPEWLRDCDTFFLTQTSDEYSIFAPESCIPSEITRTGGYRCLRVDGDLAFDAVGVVARVSRPLAEAGMSLFVVSTHDRDYVLVHKDDIENAKKVYETAGFTVNG